MGLKSLQRRMRLLLAQEAIRPKPIVKSTDEPSEEEVDRELAWYFTWATAEEVQALDAIGQRRENGHTEPNDAFEVDSICMSITTRMKWNGVDQIDPSTLDVSQ